MPTLSNRSMLQSGLVKRTYDITRKQARGLEKLKDKGNPAAVSLRFALERYLTEELGPNYQ